MDKETLSNYGWIVIVALVGMVMLMAISPWSNYIFDAIKKDTIDEIKDVSIGEESTVNIKDSADRKKITFVLNGGKIENGFIDGYLPGASITLPTNVSKVNYEFGGWYKNDSFSGNNETEISIHEKSDLTYYAKWIPQKFVISYNLNGGSFDKPEDVKYHYIYGKNFNLPTPSNYGRISKPGYEFVGWYDTETDAPFVYNTEMSKEITVYAKWKNNN